MTFEARLRYLRWVLTFAGVVMVFGLPVLMMWLWPAGFAWEPRQPEYELMIMGVYAVLGVFLIGAARDPLRHRSLIWFTVWSSAVHGLIMLVQAAVDASERANLAGDVPALLIVAGAVAWLMPRTSEEMARE